MPRFLFYIFFFNFYSPFFNTRSISEWSARKMSRHLENLFLDANIFWFNGDWHPIVIYVPCSDIILRRLRPLATELSRLLPTGWVWFGCWTRGWNGRIFLTYSTHQTALRDSLPLSCHTLFGSARLVQDPTRDSGLITSCPTFISCSPFSVFLPTSILTQTYYIAERGIRWVMGLDGSS